MRLEQRTAVAYVGGFLLALTGCAGGCGRPVHQKTPDDWKGTYSIDPAGDLARLQGKWDQPTSPDGLGGVTENWIEVKGDVLTFRGRSKTLPDFQAKYRFVVNSKASPKIIRFVDWLGAEEPWPGHQAPQARWFELTDNTLTLWDKWAELGEKNRVVYHRSNTIE